MTADWCASQSERYRMWAWICLVIAGGGVGMAWRLHGAGMVFGVFVAVLFGAFWLQCAWNARFYRRVVADPVMWSYVTRPDIDDGHHVIRATTFTIRVVRYARGRYSSDGFYLDSYNYAALVKALLDPLGNRGSRIYRRAFFDHRIANAMSGASAATSASAAQPREPQSLSRTADSRSRLSCGPHRNHRCSSTTIPAPL